MKTLKVKSIFFSLLAVLAVSVLLVSCEQNTITDSIADEATLKVTATLTAPADVYDKGDEYLSNYFATASEDLLIKLSNNYIVAKALEGAGQISQVVENEAYGFHFSDVDLSKYLSDTQISEVQANLSTNTLSTQNVELRCGWNCYSSYEWNGWCQCWKKRCVCW